MRSPSFEDLAMQLYIGNKNYSSWSMRPWIAMKAAGIGFDEVVIPLYTDDADKQKILDYSPAGKVPILIDGGVTIWDSLAILEYLAEKFPDKGFWPADAGTRAHARAICAEMVSGFSAMRNELSCHLFGRVPSFKPSEAARTDIERVFEIWNEKLEASGGPFLFGRFTIADAMYFPVLTRFRTYGIELPRPLVHYAEALEAQPAVQALIAVAATAPRIPVYDDYLRRFGGDPDAGLHAKK